MSFHLEAFMNSKAAMISIRHTSKSGIATTNAGTEGEDIHSLIVANPSADENIMSNTPTILHTYFMLSL